MTISGFDLESKQQRRQSLGGAVEVAAVLDGVLAAEDAGYGFGVGQVLLLEDAGGEGFGGVFVEDGDGLLQDDDAVVDGFVDEVDGAAGYLGSVVEGLVLGVEAGEGGEERGVDVEDAVGEGLDEGGRDDAHVAGEADEVDLVVVEAGDHLGVVVGALAAGGGDGDGGQAEVSGGGEAGGVFDVGEDYGYFGVVEAVILDRAVDGEEVRASAGEEDAEFLHWGQVNPFEEPLLLCRA